MLRKDFQSKSNVSELLLVLRSLFSTTSSCNNTSNQSVTLSSTVQDADSLSKRGVSPGDGVNVCSNSLNCWSSLKSKKSEDRSLPKLRLSAISVSALNIFLGCTDLDDNDRLKPTVDFRMGSFLVMLNRGMSWLQLMDVVGLGVALWTHFIAGLGLGAAAWTHFIAGLGLGVAPWPQLIVGLGVAPWVQLMEAARGLGVATWDQLMLDAVVLGVAKCDGLGADRFPRRICHNRS